MFRTWMTPSMLTRVVMPGKDALIVVSPINRIGLSIRGAV
jgi:hypothetical protein